MTELKDRMISLNDNLKNGGWARLTDALIESKVIRDFTTPIFLVYLFLVIGW